MRRLLRIPAAVAAIAGAAGPRRARRRGDGRRRRPANSPRASWSSSSRASGAARTVELPAGRRRARGGDGAARATRGSPTPSPTTSPPPRRRAGAAFAIPNDPGTLDGAARSCPRRRLGLQAVELPPLGGHRHARPADLARRHRRGRRLGEPRSRSAARAPQASRSRCSTPASPTATRAAASGAAPTSPAASSSRATTSSTTTALPLDENGHGTHVAGTIAEKTDNGIGLTGLAYRAKLMPVRVLDRHGRGDADDIAKGIRFAVAHGAQVINMSFNFGCGKKVPGVDEALREAYAQGRRHGRLGRQPRLRDLRLGAGDRAAGDRRRRHHRGRLPRRLLAGRQRRRRVAPGGGDPVAGCPSVSARPIYQVTLQAGSDATLRRSPATTSAPRWPPPTSAASPRWSSPAASIDPQPKRRRGVEAGSTATRLPRHTAPQPRPAARPSRAPA